MLAEAFTGSYTRRDGQPDDLPYAWSVHQQITPSLRCQRP